MSHTPLSKNFAAQKTRRESHGFLAKMVAIAILSVGTIAFGITAIDYVQVVSNAPKEISLRLAPTPTPHYQNIALMGYGGGSHDGGALTDSIIVARIDDKVKKIFLISVPRDLWVSLPFENNLGDPVKTKINAAYALGLDDNYYRQKPKEYSSKNGGGGKLARYALGQVLGEDISHFAAVSFKAFTTFVDALGGITVTRNTSFTDEWYPVDGKEKDTCEKSEEDLKAIEATMSGEMREHAFGCRYEKLTFDAGAVSLDGETALKYARSRHSETEGGDFYRSQRQRQVILAVKDKLLSFSGIPALVEFAGQVYKYIDTDYSLADIPSLISLFMSKKDYEVEAIALTDKNTLKNWTGPSGEYALIPQNGEGDFSLVHEYLKDRYYGFSEASATARFDAVANPPTPTVKREQVTGNSGQ